MAPVYIEKKAPNGSSYWVHRDDPTKGYLVDPAKNPGAIAYPIEYINWLLRATMPTAQDTRPAATGPESKEIGGQALGTPKGLIYGQALVGPSVFFGPRTKVGDNRTLIAGFGLGHGPNHSLLNTIFPHGKTLAQLAGAYSQEFFPGLLSPPAAYGGFLSAVSGSNASTFERYPGLCYVGAEMVYVPHEWEGITTPYPIPKFLVKGRLVRNYQTGIDEWTDNPSYCTADYIVSRRYGRGATVNVNSVIDAAAYCNETFLNSATGQQEKKHTLNYFMLRQAYHKSHIDALRAHFRCNIIERGGEFIFLIDKDRPVSMSFDETEAVPVTVQRMGGLATPNVVSVAHTDPADNYTVKRQYARTSEVEAGLVATKAADYELEGFDRASVAASEAYFLLNTRLNNLRVVLRAVHPKARRLEPNDVIAFTQSSFGMTGFLLRVIKSTRAQDGTAWMIECVGHDPAIYGFQSRAVETYPLPQLPPITDTPAAPAGLTVSDAGNSVLMVEFTPEDDHPFYSRTRVTLDRTIGGVTETFNLGEVASGPLSFSVVGSAADYQAHAWTLLSNGAESAVANSNTLNMAGVAGPQGPQGAAGVNGVAYVLSNEAHTVPANLDGSSPDLTGANGLVTVLSGATDVTATATFGTVTATGCTGTVNTAANTPVAGQPKGYYRVTAMTADTATLDMPITYGGTTVTLRFSLAKSKQGATGSTGAAGVNAKTMVITSDRQVISYDETGAVNPASQTTTFTANKQNTTATVTWTATRADGVAISPVTNLLSAATGNSVTMTAANFNTQRGATEGVIVTATLTDGTTISDTISVLRVQKGATGAGMMTLVPQGTGATVFDPSSIGKVGGTEGAWSVGVHSLEGHARGCYVSFRPAQTNKAFMVGLNNDPALNATFSGIDYAWYARSDATLEIYESGVAVATYGAYTAATVLLITYDGVNVRYFKDGLLQRTVSRAIGAALYLDSSFFNNGTTAQVVNLAFGPMAETSTGNLVAQGTATIFSPTELGKTSGSDGWGTASVYSTEGFTRGCAVSFKPNQTNLNFVIGLNSDPTTDMNYTSIDYGIQCAADGTILILESGVGITGFGSYTTTTILSIIYDGVNVRYLKDGVVIRSVPRLIGNALHFDSSFFSSSATPILSSFSFRPVGESASKPIMTLITHGTGTKVFSGSEIGKTAGGAGWDAGAYSAEGYSTDCYVSFRPAQANTNAVVGLNTDPTTNANYTTIDYAWYVVGLVAYIYESGVSLGSFGSCTTSTVLSIIYDGAYVRYYKDSVLERSVPRAVGAALHIDSSIHDVSPVAHIKDLAFGPIPENPTALTITGTKVTWDASRYRTNKLKGAAFWSNGGGLNGFTAGNVNNGDFSTAAFSTVSGTTGYLVYDNGVGNSIAIREILIAASSTSGITQEYSDDGATWFAASSSDSFFRDKRWADLAAAAGRSVTRRAIDVGSHRFTRLVINATATFYEVEFRAYGEAYAGARYRLEADDTGELIGEYDVPPSAPGVELGAAFRYAGSPYGGGTREYRIRIRVANADGVWNDGMSYSLGQGWSNTTSGSASGDIVDLDIGGRTEYERQRGVAEYIYTFTPTASPTNVHGIYSANGERVRYGRNGSASVSLTLKHQSATETTVARRLTTPAGTDLVVPAGRMFIAIDNGSSWLVQLL